MTVDAQISKNELVWYELNRINEKSMVTMTCHKRGLAQCL